MAEWTSVSSLDETAARRAYRSLWLNAHAVILSVALLLVALMHFLGAYLDIDMAAAGTAFILYAAISAIALANLNAHGHRRFGAANIITTIRAAITATIGGLVLASGDFGENVAAGALWAQGFLVAFALALDGIDGYLARRSGTESRFGARFDMEIDALLIFFLSLAAEELGKAGMWVLLIGLMRYAYVLAQALFPALRGDLQPSWRRKAICVVQGVALCLLLFPVLVPPLSNIIAAVALGLLVYSFAVDVVYLLRSARRRKNRPGIAPASANMP